MLPCFGSRQCVHHVQMSFVSIVEEFDCLQNCVPRISSYLPTMHNSLFATIFSSSLSRHFNCHKK